MTGPERDDGLVRRCPEECPCLCHDGHDDAEHVGGPCYGREVR
jgi:hypothetical protein